MSYLGVMKRGRYAAGLCCWGAMVAVMSLFAISAYAGSTVQGAVAVKPFYRVIVQIDSGGNGAIKKTLSNIENLLRDPRLKGKVKIELIANGNGFDVYVKNNGFEARLRHLLREGVLFTQCANTLRASNVDRNDLYSFVSVVPSGVGEIVLREAEGWAYLHPSAPTEEPL